jgi:YjbE family integral membrane protein
VVWLLQIPGLMLVGGLGLLWIAYKLLADQGGGHNDGPVVTTFWGAMRTIVIADALMGVDNVLGVAGAAHGQFDLVVIGLLLSVPIMVFGSSLVLRLVDRFPIIIMVGSAVLALTAAQMILGEAMLSEYLAGDELFPLRVAVYVLAVVGVCGGGWLAARRSAPDENDGGASV